ncbi:MAG TPA: SprT family zinc-dependent metalloprotease [Candidatus Cloacimonadota bacterium]|nr:SprT family zinc-dependent metalloprotease [Candidatus Cloacimonadota bacterium]
MERIQLGDLEIEVLRKDIKNIHLSVYPPTGRVRISAPQRMELDTIRVFAIAKLKWIRKQQENFKKQQRETPREYLTRESHYFLGERYLLKVIEQDASPKVLLKHKEIQMYVRPETTQEKRQEVLDNWYRQELKRIIPPMIEHWEQKAGVVVYDYGIKKMRTKWGTCNHEAKRIWLNLELAKKPLECIEYIIVHEVLHLIEPSHNERFIALLDDHMPKWKFYRDELNRLPFGHVEWRY